MSPLRGNKEERAAENAELRAEVERLCRLSVTNLAAEIFPAWGADGPVPPPYQLSKWLVRAYPQPRLSVATVPLEQPVEEAIQLLEQSGLLLRSINSSGGSTYRLTRLGAAALAQGTVRDHLPSAAQPGNPPRPGSGWTW
jgi:hypothetical protein